MADFKMMRIGLSPIDYTPIFPYASQAGNGKFLDGAADYVEWRFQAEKTTTITKLGFRVGLTTGTPPTYRVSIQGITGGVANGVVAGFGNFTPPLSYSDEDWQGHWIWVNISPASITQGNYYAMVIDYVSGYVSLANMIEIEFTLSGTNFRHFPGATTGSQLSSSHPIFGLKDSEGEVFGNPLRVSYDYLGAIDLPHPREHAIAFTLPAGFGTEFKIAGIQIIGEMPTGADATTFNVTLYDGELVIGQTTMHTGVPHYGSHGNWGGNSYIFLFNESTLAKLVFGRQYYISVRANSAAMASLSWTHFLTPDSDDHEGWPGGQYFHMATRDTSAQATDEETPTEWQQDFSKRPICEFILSEWGGPGYNVDGAHLKFTPAWNDNVLIQHADDQINNTPNVGDYEPHESFGVPIGNCIESYSGYLTVEVFANPDAERTENSLIVNETDIQDLKVINLEPWEDGVYELVFRLRAKYSSPYYKEVTRFLRVIT